MLVYPQNIKIDYERALNKEQRQVVMEAEGPCLVLAGAGSGKTRTLIYRLAYLLEKGVAANRILLMTFTNKAAKEMLGRIAQLLNYQPTDLWGGTFHHIGNRVLRMFGAELGWPINFNILDSTDSKELMKTCYKDLVLSEDKKFPKAEVAQKIISLAANLNCDLESVLSERFGHLPRKYWSDIFTINDLYQQKKARAEAYDFDDLLIYWWRLMTMAPAIKNKLAEQFQYILVDEYQDTNRLQGEIIKQLAGGAANVLVVGDDAQSIYSFRGAEVNNILQFPKIFPACRIFKLETNYRSTPEILTLANKSIAQNASQFNKQLHTTKTQSERPILVQTVDPLAQAEFIAEEILSWHNDQNLAWSKIAVLFRSHYQSLELELVLQQKHIPYEMRGGLRFFEQAHIKDVLAFLKILNNYRDESAWRRLLNQWEGFGPAQMDKIILAGASAISLSNFLDNMPSGLLTKKADNSWENVKNILRALLTDKGAMPSDLLEKIFRVHYFDYLTANYDNALERAEDLRQLQLFARGYEKIETLLNDALLAENFCDREATGMAKKKESEAVVLSTIHQAKGLEWPVVFVMGLVDGQFPNKRMFNRPQDVEEERRLFYVAVTRAEERLYLTYPIFSAYGATVNKVSQFIRELPDEIYEKIQMESREEIR